MAIVLGAIGLVFWALRRFVPSFGSLSPSAVKVVARTSLGPRQNLSLIQVGRRFVLVAVSPARVDVVCEVDDYQEAAELAAMTGAAWSARGEFETAFHRSADAIRDAELQDEDEPLGMESGSVSPPVADLLRKLKALRRSA